MTLDILKSTNWTNLFCIYYNLVFVVGWMSKILEITVRAKCQLVWGWSSSCAHATGLATFHSDLLGLVAIVTVAVVGSVGAVFGLVNACVWSIRAVGASSHAIVHDTQFIAPLLFRLTFLPFVDTFGRGKSFATSSCCIARVFAKSASLTTNSLDLHSVVSFNQRSTILCISRAILVPVKTGVWSILAKSTCSQTFMHKLSASAVAFTFQGLTLLSCHFVDTFA